MRRPVVRLPARSDAAPMRVVFVREFDEEAVEMFVRDVARVREARQPVLPVMIDSKGGEVYDVFAMMDALGTFDGLVVTIGIGQVMSCGAALFTCGHKGHRYIAPSATVMLHNVTSPPFGGKAREQTSNANETARLDAALWRRMSTNLGLPADDLFRRYEARGGVDWYLTAAEAVKEGLASRVGLPVFQVSLRLDPLLGVEV